jgi:small subunit ribosomal protein S17
MSVSNSIGIPGVTDPEKKCEDPSCPFHGSLKVHGKIFTGMVKSTKMTNAISVKIDMFFFDTKYQRYERRNSKMTVHCPPCIELKEGDIVRFMQCRPLSKTISSVVIQKIEKTQK